MAKRQKGKRRLKSGADEAAGAPQPVKRGPGGRSRGAQDVV